MKKWLCEVCGYIHVGDSAPDVCPVCGAGSEFFAEMAEGAEDSSQGKNEDQPNREELQNVLFKIPCGLFVVNSISGSKLNGMVNNTLFQITDSPLQVILGMDKRHLTTTYIQTSLVFSVNFLKPDQLGLIKQFGFKSGREVDKFSGLDWYTAKTGAPIINQAAGYLDCRVQAEKILDAGTHLVFMAEVIDGKVDKDAPILSYQEYRDRKKELWNQKNG